MIAEQPGGGEPVQFGARQAALGVALGGARAELVGQFGGHGQRLGVVGDDVRGHRRRGASRPSAAAASRGGRPQRRGELVDDLGQGLGGAGRDGQPAVVA